MLIDFEKNVDLEIEFHKNILKRFQKRESVINQNLGNSNRKGNLVANIHNGKIRYFTSVYNNGRERRSYLGKHDDEYRKELQERYYLRRAIKMCKQNLEILNFYRNELSSLDPDDVVADAPLAYREQENAKCLLYDNGSNYRWKKRKEEFKARFETYKPEELKHIAGDGTITRSKSETLIVDLLNAKNLPFVYECPIQLRSGRFNTVKNILPDFLVYDRKHNREILIEHMGLMSQYEYRTSQYDKLGLYIENGYVPNVNLLLTFDDKDGKINIPAISSAVDAILLR